MLVIGTKEDKCNGCYDTQFNPLAGKISSSNMATILRIISNNRYLCTPTKEFRINEKYSLYVHSALRGKDYFEILVQCARIPPVRSVFQIGKFFANTS